MILTFDSKFIYIDGQPYRKGTLRAFFITDFIVKLISGVWNNQGLRSGGTDQFAINSITNSAGVQPFVNRLDFTTFYEANFFIPAAAGGTYIPVTEKGAAGGVATLDGGGTVTLEQIPKPKVYQFTIGDGNPDTPAAGDTNYTDNVGNLVPGRTSYIERQTFGIMNSQQVTINPDGFDLVIAHDIFNDGETFTIVQY